MKPTIHYYMLVKKLENFLSKYSIKVYLKELDNTFGITALFSCSNEICFYYKEYNIIELRGKQPSEINIHFDTIYEDFINNIKKRFGIRGPYGKSGQQD